MSDNLYSSDDDIIEPTPNKPDNRKLLNVVMFRRKKTKTEEVVISTDSEEPGTSGLQFSKPSKDNEKTKESKKRKRGVSVSERASRSKAREAEESADNKERASRSKARKAEESAGNKERASRSKARKAEESAGNKPRRKGVTEKASRTAKWVEEATPRNKVAKKKRRIRDLVKCTQCGKLQQNIWRHMKQMHEKPFKTIEEKPQVSKFGYILRYCPIRNCGSVVERMKDHLVRTHNVARESRMMTRLMGKAKAVTERYQKDIEKEVKKERKTEEEGIIIIDSSEESIKMKKTDNSSKREMSTQYSEDDFQKTYVAEPIPIEKPEEESEEEPEGELVYIGLPDENPFGPTQAVIQDSKEQDAALKSEPDSDSHSFPDSDVEIEYHDNTMIREFIRYLKEPPNLKTSKTAFQHGSQAYEIWKFISPKLIVEGLFDLDKFNKWVANVINKFAPGTVRSYLGSIQLFIDFLMAKRHTDEISRAVKMREMSKLTSKNMKKKVMQRRTVIETEEIETMILPVDIQGFLECDFAKEVENQIARNPQEIVPADFFNVRDYLLLRLLQTNAQRPMAVRNISTQSVERARETDDGGAVISVAEHKTSQYQGPAILYLDRNLYEQLKTYIQMIKRIPRYPKDRTRSIFTSWPKTDGTVSDMTSSHVNKAIQRVWARGPSQKKHISATRIRKATSTAVRLAHPAAREVLAKHMSHNPETADRHYALFKKQEMAVPVTQMIKSVMEGPKALTFPGFGLSTEQEDSDQTVDYDVPMITQDDTRLQSNIGDSQVQSQIKTQDDSPVKSQNDTQDELLVESQIESQDELPVESQIDSQDDSQVESQIESQDELPVESQIESQDDSQVQLRIDSEIEVQSSQSKHGRRSFEASEAESLIQMCEAEIMSGEINKITVMERVTSSAEGRTLYLKLKSRLGTRDVWKVITDRLRTERKKRKKMVK